MNVQLVSFGEDQELNIPPPLLFGAIKRELRRRSAIEPVIGHMKAITYRIFRTFRIDGFFLE